MVDPHKAWAIIAAALTPLPQIRLPLAVSVGYVLAEDVRADRDLPPADRSAMDGYAVRHSDLQARPGLLKLVGEVAAGSSARPRVAPGTCARIMTGANIPPGADSVVMQEDTAGPEARALPTRFYDSGRGRAAAPRNAGQASLPSASHGLPRRPDLIRVVKAVQPGANILRRGEDARKGHVLLRKGDVLDASRIGVCASVGCSATKVFRRPRITVLCTGAELKAPEDTVRPYQVRNSNGPAICAALTLRDFDPVTYHALPDKVGRLAAALRQTSLRYDVILLTGGM